MTQPTTFESRVASVLEALADEMPSDVDPVRVAQAAATAPGRAHRNPGIVSWRGRSPGILAFAILGLLAATFAGLLVAGVPQPRIVATPRPTSPLVYAPASPTPALPSERVGFLGLPPEGAAPSQPTTGDLVLSYVSRPFWKVPGVEPWGGHLSPIVQIHLYADGRLVWAITQGTTAYGATPSNTGLLEQRFTPEGAQVLVNEALATGLFDTDREINRGGVTAWAHWRVWAGEEFIAVGIGSDLRPEIDRTSVSPEQWEALRRLHSILTEPVSWLPESAWLDREIRAFVPSAYGACGNAAIASLPPEAQDILRGAPASAPDRDVGTSVAYPSGCLTLSTDDARALAAVLDAAGLERDSRIGDPAWIVAAGRANQVLGLDAILPDGSPSCLGCG